MITVDPPEVHPSLGEMAFMHGVATGKGGYNPAVRNIKILFYESYIRIKYKLLSLRS